jgi:3-isopropylmalate/(R)-2-methylmalate dehydratase small subunit
VTADAVEGWAIVLDDDVNTDNILPGPYLNVTDPDELGAHLLETYDGDAGARIRPGDILVAGRNFGMGSSREQAQIAILARGVQAVLAASFARIFLRNAVNVGLPVVESPEASAAIADGDRLRSPEASAAIADGDRLRIDFVAGCVERGGDRWQVPPRPPFMSEIIDAGGLVECTRRRLNATGPV